MKIVGKLSSVLALTKVGGGFGKILSVDKGFKGWYQINNELLERCKEAGETRSWECYRSPSGKSVPQPESDQ